MERLSGVRAAVVAALAIGCATPPESGEVLVLARANDGTYSLEGRDLGASSFRPLSTAHYDFFANATIGMNDDGSPSIEGAEPFELDLVSGDPHVPASYEALFTASAAYALEQSYAFYESLGLGTTVPHPARYSALVYPDRPIGGRPYTDNAAFAPSTQAIYLAPDQLWARARAPLAVSGPVITHEMGHAMIHHLVVEVQGRRPPEMRNPVEAAINEGLADTFAIAHYGVSSPFRDSYGDEYPVIVDPRDVASEWAFTAELEQTIDDADASPYPVGTVVARTFWLHAEETADVHGGMREALRAGARIAFEALQTIDLYAITHPLDVFEHILAMLDPASEDHAGFCAALAITFERSFAEVSSCM